ncbi:hypothetical protein KCU62_g2310, partial [Aureobasidium sp. EXF-3399]
MLQYGSEQQYLHSYLMNNQVKVACNQVGCKEKEHMFYLPLGDVDDNNYDRWQLTTDSTVTPRCGDITSELAGWEFAGLELVSRVQKFEGTSRCPTGQKYPCNGKPLSWTWRDEFKAFLELIRKAFSEAGFYAFVNKTTGLHVHLGHGDKGLPVEVVKGLLGTMTALERSFDQIHTAGRISGPVNMRVPGPWSLKPFIPLPGIDIEGFHSLYKPGLVEGQDFYNQWCPAMSSTMFQSVHSQIYHTATQTEPEQALTTTPTDASAAAASVSISAETAKYIERYLSSFNVPSWLNTIKEASSVQQLKTMFTADKYTALSLRGLGEDNDHRIPTAEVRTHAGSIDLAEISAWVDLLTGISHWAETTPQEKVFSYLEESWRDVDYNICRLAREVGASDSTIAHYDDVLSDRYAQLRFDKYTSSSLRFTDKLGNLNRITEEQRRKDLSRESVEEKIRLKLESGRYGQLPTSFLEAQPEPEIFSRPEAKFLHLGEEGQKAWSEYLKDYYRAERKLDLTSKDSVDDSDTAPADGIKEDGASDSESVAAGAEAEENQSSSDEKSVDSDDSDKTIRPPKSPVDETEIDSGFYGIHPALANAYNSIPGQHLAYLEETVASMPALPSPTLPDMTAFEELKTDTVTRIANAFLNEDMIANLAAAESKDEVARMLAGAVEADKQLHVLESCLAERALAQKYLDRKGKKE